MNFTLAGKYAAHSDCGKYAITWGDQAPPYHAHLRSNPHYRKSLGKHDSKASAKAACVMHSQGRGE